MEVFGCQDKAGEVIKEILNYDKDRNYENRPVIKDKDYYSMNSYLNLSHLEDSFLFLLLHRLGI